MKNQLYVEMIRFSCPSCQKNLKSPQRGIGQKRKCPSCNGLVVIPQKSTRWPGVPKVIPVVVPIPDDQGVVPVAVNVPGVGGLDTKVTQKTADSMATTFLGGILVVIGVLLCAALGRKPPGA